MIHDIAMHAVHHDLQLLGLVELVDFTQPRGHRVHLLLPLLEGDAVAETRHDGEPGRIPREVADVARQDAPRVDVRRHRRVRGQIDAEVRWEHPNHDRAPAIHLDGAADDGTIAPEPPLPEPVGQHHLARAAGSGFGWPNALGSMENASSATKSRPSIGLMPRSWNRFQVV